MNIVELFGKMYNVTSKTIFKVYNRKSDELKCRPPIISGTVEELRHSDYLCENYAFCEIFNDEITNKAEVIMMYLH